MQKIFILVLSRVIKLKKNDSTKKEDGNDEKIDRNILKMIVGIFMAAGMSSGITVSTEPNATYNIVLFHIAMIMACVSNQSVTGLLQSERTVHDIKWYKRGVPNGEWVRNIFEQIDVVPDFVRIVENQMQRMQQFSRTKFWKIKFDIAIDETKLPRYDKKITDVLRKGKQKCGTTAFESYVTAQCVNTRLTLGLAVLAFKKGVRYGDAVQEIVNSIKRYHLRIGVILLDRGFYTVLVMDTLDKAGLKFVMPAKQSKKLTENIKRYIDSGYNPKFKKFKMLIADKKAGKWFEYTGMIEKRTGLRKKVKKSDPEAWIVFATNDPTIKTKKYASRWNIETGYRIRDSIHPKTSVSNPNARLYCFVYSLVFLNEWYIAREAYEASPDPTVSKRQQKLTMTTFKLMFCREGMHVYRLGTGPPPLLLRF